MNVWKSIVGLIVTSMLSVPLWAQGNTCEEQLNAARHPTNFRPPFARAPPNEGDT